MNLTKSDLQLLLGIQGSQAQYYIERYCIANDLKYTAKVEIGIKELSKFILIDLPLKVDQFRKYHLKFRDNKTKILNDRMGISKGKMSPSLEKLLDPVDVDLILRNWEQKRKQLTLQMQM